MDHGVLAVPQWSPLQNNRALPQVWAAYNGALDTLAAAGQPRGDAGTKLRAVARAAALPLRVGSGADAMSLLCSSERVFADCIDWLEHGEPEQVGSTCTHRYTPHANPPALAIHYPCTHSCADALLRTRTKIISQTGRPSRVVAARGILR